LIGKITAEGYKKMEPEVKALVEKDGNISLIFDMTDFKWEKIEAWLPDLKFGHEKIQKMAIVGDKTWEKWITHLAHPLYAKEAKCFHSADMPKAWSWLKE
jgi:SpoIIAA-like